MIGIVLVIVCSIVLILAWFYAMQELVVMWRAGFIVQSLLLLAALFVGTFGTAIGWLALTNGVPHGL